VATFNLAHPVCRYASSDAFVHPAKTVGQNEMQFSKDTQVVQSNTVLVRGPGAPREGEI